MYSQDYTQTPSSRVPLYKQYEKVPNGEFLVTRVFKPNKYPQATLVTPYFRVTMEQESWEEIKGKLWEFIKSGGQISIYHTRGKWEIRQTVNFEGIQYFPDTYGLACHYDKPEDCFIPAKDSQPEIKPSFNGDIPF